MMRDNSKHASFQSSNTLYSLQFALRQTLCLRAERTHSIGSYRILYQYHLSTYLPPGRLSSASKPARPTAEEEPKKRKKHAP